VSPITATNVTALACGLKSVRNHFIENRLSSDPIRVISSGQRNDVQASDLSCEGLILASRDAGPVLSDQSKSSMRNDPRVKPEHNDTVSYLTSFDANHGWNYSRSEHGARVSACIRTHPLPFPRSNSYRGPISGVWVGKKA